MTKPDDVQASLANMVILLAKHSGQSVSKGSFNTQTTENLVPFFKVLCQFSVMDSEESNMTTNLLKRLLQWLEQHIKLLQEDIPEAQFSVQLQNISKSISSTLISSKEANVFHPIFKLVKAGINQLASEVNFLDFLLKNTVNPRFKRVKVTDFLFCKTSV